MAACATLLAPGGARGQEPPTDAPVDSVVADSLAAGPAAADTLPVETGAAADTLPVQPGAVADSLPGDTLLAGPDSLPADAVAVADTVVVDSIQLEHLPMPPQMEPDGWETGVWTWDREELLASRATTLAELLGEVPGVVELRGGDYGMPQSATAFGAGGGGIRVYRDGIEVLPLEGSVVDLSRVGLAGADEVRLERTGSGLRVELRSLRLDDPRPYSLVEAGTGDLDTNLLRGVFFHPRALGGNGGLSLERRDTQGPRRQEPGAATSFWLHYAYLVDERFGVAADLSRSSTSRDTIYVPGQVTRTDWRLRGRWRPMDGVVTDLFWVRSSLEEDSTSGSLEGFPFPTEPRSQWGGRISAERGPVSLRATYRDPQGRGLARRRASGEVVARLQGFGGVAGEWRWADWSGRGTTTLGLRGWTEPHWGLSAFGGWEDFETGVPALLPSPPEAPGDVRVSEGRFLRLGGRFAWRGLELSGARIELERDSVHPLGLPMDRGGLSLPEGRRTGWEGEVRLPLLLVDGLALKGSGQIWEETPDPWPYLPRRSWLGALSLHDTYLDSGNLEVWLDVGVQRRDAMAVALPASVSEEPGDGGEGGGDAGAPVLATGPAAAVPLYRSYYARLQIRVVSVRIFVRWDNFTLRAVNQDFPGRVLPRTRALYGVRWTLWN